MDEIRIELNKLYLKDIKNLVRTHNMHYHIKLTKTNKSKLINDLIQFINDSFSTDYIYKALKTFKDIREKTHYYLEQQKIKSEFNNAFKQSPPEKPKREYKKKKPVDRLTQPITNYYAKANK